MKKNTLDNILEFIAVGTVFLIFIGIVIFACFLALKIFIYVLTYQPDEIKIYEYIDLDNKTGRADECYTAFSYPHCYLDDNTTIAVKQYKEIWIPNPDKELSK